VERLGGHTTGAHRSSLAPRSTTIAVHLFLSFSAPVDRGWCGVVWCVLRVLLYHTYAGRVPAPHCLLLPCPAPTTPSKGEGKKGREASLGGAARSRESPPATRASPSISAPTLTTPRFAAAAAAAAARATR
jgi:hypothetical protein